VIAAVSKPARPLPDPQRPQSGEIVVLPDFAALAHEAARRFAAAAAAAVTRKGRFTAALAGGSTPAGLYRLLAQEPFREQVPWPETLLYLGDERCVPADDPRSNTRMIHETLLAGIASSPPTLRVPPTELPPPEAAAAYARQLRRDFSLRGAGRPRFDLILLGVGDDGHTASLFPGMPALDDPGPRAGTPGRGRRRLVVATEVPAYVRPHVPRITFTLPVLNAAEHVIFLASGTSKASAVAAVLGGSEPEHPLPARRVQAPQGRLTWLLDAAAASELR
jgi:6-phosphogluconolactonase